jgi:hypothetical protein
LPGILRREHGKHCGIGTPVANEQREVFVPPVPPADLITAYVVLGLTPPLVGLVALIIHKERLNKCQEETIDSDTRRTPIREKNA